VLLRPKKAAICFRVEESADWFRPRQSADGGNTPCSTDKIKGHPNPGRHVGSWHSPTFALGYDRYPLRGNRYELPNDKIDFQVKLATKIPE